MYRRGDVALPPPPDSEKPSRRDFLRFTEAAALAAAVAWLMPSVNPTDAAAATTLNPLRPPATPLAVRSPYLSTWLAGDNLAGQWPSFWNGRNTGMAGIVTVDDDAFIFAGAPNETTLPLLNQVSLTVTGSRSVYQFEEARIRLTVTFLSPVDPGELQRQSVPMSYITVSAHSADGEPHRIGIYLDVTGEWAHGDNNRPIDWRQQVVGNQIALSFSPTEPGVFAEHNDQASWGTIVFATDSDPGLSWQIAEASAARTVGAHKALPNSAEPGPRAIGDRWPAFAFRRDFGEISPDAPDPVMVLSIGHIRTPAVSYLGQALEPWWRNYWPDWPAMLTWFRADYPVAVQHSDAIDARITDDAGEVFGAETDLARQYAALCALALRQTFAGTELVNYNGKPWAMLKEISSNGNMCTVDVIYPTLPALLYISPGYLKLLLEPLFGYVTGTVPNDLVSVPTKPRWPQPFAPHDLGLHYPVATGHDDGGGENMPVEESANMLLMSAALVLRIPKNEATAFATQRYSVLRGWAEYLVANAKDPGHQNQTDDFTGFIAHSSNLALKGILAIAAMSRIAHAAGNLPDQENYRKIATDYLQEWLRLSKDPAGTHLKLAYDQNGTWSLKYNGYVDRLLGLNLIPDSVTAMESAWYQGKANKYGVPLDLRHTYTKVDWELWTAGFLVAQPEARDMLVRKVFQFANETPDRVPFTDWHDTVTGSRTGFAARPVIGGVFSLLALLSDPVAK